jgi:hypothetical protein
MHSLFESFVREICPIWNVCGMLLCILLYLMKRILNSTVCQGSAQLFIYPSEPSWTKTIRAVASKRKGIVVGSSKWETNGGMAYFCSSQVKLEFETAASNFAWVPVGGFRCPMLRRLRITFVSPLWRHAYDMWRRHLQYQSVSHVKFDSSVTEKWQPVDRRVLGALA